MEKVTYESLLTQAELAVKIAEAEYGVDLDDLDSSSKRDQNIREEVDKYIDRLMAMPIDVLKQQERQL